MLHIRQKRGVSFAKSQPQPSSSHSTTVSTSASSKTAKVKPTPGHARYVSTSSTAAPKRSKPQQPQPKVTNRQRRLASLFMALMASSPLPIETDAEILEAAQKASIAPKVQPATTTRKKTVGKMRVQEVRKGRWRRFRLGAVKVGRGKGREEDIEMERLVGRMG